jgi:RES domain/HEPN/RES N-terminal domain 1
MANDIDDLKGKQVCYRCIGEGYLKAEIQSQGKRAACSYCGRRMRSYTIGDMADRIEKVFDEHYRRTADQPDGYQLALLSDRESDYTWYRDGEPVIDAIRDSADMPQQAAEDIQEILEDRFASYHHDDVGEETEFSSEAHYEEKEVTDSAWQEEWRYFEQSLKTEARFFSKSAAAHLASIFGGVDKKKSRDGRSLVIDAGPEASLGAIYRARVFQSTDDLLSALCRPDQQLGSPPPKLASAGRMNAQGISVFYGANEPGVAIAEVRPPVGSQVAVARFKIVRKLRLLDLTALRDVSEGGSIFDPGLAARLAHATFMRSLSERLTQPVMPSDEQLDYLPTQAIADFLATENDPPLDGIVFPSVQVTGEALNVVLFHKAARVQTLDIPAGTEISASAGMWTEDGWEVDYWVSERVPKKRRKRRRKPEKAPFAFDPEAFVSGSSTPEDADARDPTLQIEVESVKVHFVRGVQFNWAEYEVHRHRSEKDKKLPF